MSYRAPDPSEERPQPKDGEVVIFADHMSRGFALPGSKFFRDVLNFFDLRPQDIGPNSVSNICNFQVFCEVYLGEVPSLLLFRELFYLNRQNECANGPSLELGGISIQRRRDCLFPYAEPPSHPKDWNMTWFYCQDTSPADESPLPGFRPSRLEANTPSVRQADSSGAPTSAPHHQQDQGSPGQWSQRNRFGPGLDLLAGDPIEPPPRLNVRVHGPKG